MALLNWVDAMGVGAFCCIGAQAGVRKVWLTPLILCSSNICGEVCSSF